MYIPGYDSSNIIQSAPPVSVAPTASLFCPIRFVSLPNLGCVLLHIRNNVFITTLEMAKERRKRTEKYPDEAIPNNLSAKLF